MVNKHTQKKKNSERKPQTPCLDQYSFRCLASRAFLDRQKCATHKMHTDIVSAFQHRVIIVVRPELGGARGNEGAERVAGGGGSTREPLFAQHTHTHAHTHVSVCTS